MRGLKSTLLRGLGTAAVVVSFVALGAPSAQAADNGWDGKEPGWDVAPSSDAQPGWDVAPGWDAKPGWDAQPGWDVAPGWDFNNGWD